MKFSFIIFLDKSWNIVPLLNGILAQTIYPLEILIVEDSSVKSGYTAQVNQIKSKVPIRQFIESNSGPGFLRNFAFDKAEGDYFIVFDSHCEIPPDYLEQIEKVLSQNQLDIFTVPIKFPITETLKEKAISYAMNVYYSIESWTDNYKDFEKLLLNSFNFGISRKVFDKTGGYVIKDAGEDLEYFLRIKNMGFKEGIIKETFVNHPPIEGFGELFRFMNSRGRGRINVYCFFPKSLKLIHFLPFLFLLFSLITLGAFIFNASVISILFPIMLLYALFIVADSFMKLRSLSVAFLTVPAVFVELWGYGAGFISELYKELSGRKKRV